MPILEGKFNKNIRDRFWELKMWSHKTADRFTKGIPDIYLGQGCWIESKIVPVTEHKGKSYMSAFEPLQRELMDDLIKVGDTPTVCLFCQFVTKSMKNDEYLLVMHWDMFKRVRRWNGQIVRFWGHDITTTVKYPLEIHYGKDRKGLWKPERNQVAWAQFQQRWPELVAGEGEYEESPKNSLATITQEE